MGILKIPRITTTDRLTITPEEGELLYDTTNDKIYKGDNSTVGGVEVGGGSGGLKSGDANYVTENVYTVTIADVTGYSSGDTYAIKFLSSNTDAITINISGQGAKDVYKNGNLPLAPGDIQANQEFILIYDGTNFQILGISPTQIFAFVTNAEATTLNKGDVVYSFSAQGNRMSVKKASNADDSTSSKTLGFVFSSTIASNGTGYIITQGVIDKMSLGSPWQAGDPVWLGSTVGTFTRTKPVAPAHSVYLGVVEKANAGNGQIYVKVQNGYELNEIHDVLISSPAADHFLVRNSANTLWINEAPSDARTSLGATTIGSNLFTATNPSAVTYIRVNANNTISFRTAGELVTDLGITGGTTDLSYTAATRLLESSSGADVTLPLFSAAAPSGSTTDAGLVPGANSTNTNLFLRSDRTWASAFASGTLSSGTIRYLPIYTGTTTLSSSLGASDAAINIAAQTGNRLYTVPDAGASASFVMTQGSQTIAGLKTFSTFTSYGSSQTQAAPTITTSRSAGSRVLIHEAFTASTQTDYAIGTETNAMWYSIPQSTSTFSHKWYGGATQLMSLRGDGILNINPNVTSNYLPATPSTTPNYPLEISTTYGTTNYTYSNIALTTVTANYTSITANVTGVTISGTGMSTFTQGTAITLSNVTGITGLSTSTSYFVINSNTTTITLAATFFDAINSNPLANTIPIKTASGTAGSGTATATYVEVTGISTGSSGAFTALTNGTTVALSNIAGITSGISSGTVYNAIHSNANSLRLSTSFLNASNGTAVSSLTGTYNALAYTGITTGAEVVVSGTTLPALTTGTAVYLSNTTGITGLNTTTIYYVYASVAGTSLKLASTAANATAGTPITTATGTQTAGGNLRGVLSVGWGPTRGSGITFWNNFNNPNASGAVGVNSSIESQVGSQLNNSSTAYIDLVFKSKDLNNVFSEKFRIHGGGDLRSVTFTGTIGSSTGTLISRHPINIIAPDNPATNPHLTITGANGYSRISYFNVTGTDFPKINTAGLARSSGERLIFGDFGNYPTGLGISTGLSPANGQSFLLSGNTSLNFTSPQQFDFFTNDQSSDVGFGERVHNPVLTITKVSGYSQSSSLILRGTRVLSTGNNKTIQEIRSNAGIINVRLNNVTNLIPDQVISISGITTTGTAYNGIVGRMRAVSSTTTYGNLVFTYGTIVANGTDVTLNGGAGNVIFLPAFITGTAVTFTTVGTTGLAVGTTYYVYGYNSSGFGSCKLAASYTDAIAGIAISGFTGSAGGGSCSVAGIAANATEGIAVYGATLTSATTIATVAYDNSRVVGTPVSLANVTGITGTGLTPNTIYYAYQIPTTGTSFRLASSFANAVAGTPITTAADTTVVNTTAIATSNTVALISSVTDTSPTNGTATPVHISGLGGGSTIGIYFDKDDDLTVSSAGTNFYTTRNTPIITFVRSGFQTGTYNLLSDSSITQTINFASNSNLINIGAPASSGYTLNIGSTANFTSLGSSPTNTINIGTGSVYQINGTNFSTTNIIIGNTGASQGSPVSQTNITLHGKIEIKASPNSNFPAISASSWTTAGVTFDIGQRHIVDTISNNGTTISTRVANSIQIQTFYSSNPITVQNAINFYIAGNAAGAGNTTVTNAWALYAEGNTRLSLLRVDGNVGFYGTTPVARATTSLSTTIIFAAGTGSTVLSGSTFGNYTILQVVQALKNIGILT